MINFLGKKKRVEEENKVKLSQTQQSQQIHSTPIIPKTDGSVVVQFALPYDIPKQLRDVTTGWDASTTYLTEKEIERITKLADAFADLELALLYRPSEIDKIGAYLLKTQLQKAIASTLRLNKSRYGYLTNLSTKTTQEIKHISVNGNEDRKSGFRRWF